MILPGDVGGDFVDDEEKAVALLAFGGFMIALNRLSAQAKFRPERIFLFIHILRTLRLCLNAWTGCSKKLNTTLPS